MPKGYHHLTRDQRCQIYILKATGKSLSEIGKLLKLHRSSISREIKRNTGGRGYRYQQADEAARRRRSQVSQTPKKLTEGLRAIIETKLKEGWSPEQISGRLNLSSPTVSHETIYRYVWQDKRAKGNLYKYLRHGGKRYNKRVSNKSGRGCIPDRIDIAERPAIVEEKIRIGDWEGDTLVGKNHQQAIVSHVDRHSKFTLLKKIKRRTADEVCRHTIKRLQRMPHPVLSITYDNGKEFSAHKKIALALNTTCYFATPYHAWERGLNEHTNGLVRQYIPKSSDMTSLTDEMVQSIEDRLNHRPRKILQYRTPFEVFFAGINTEPLGALHC